MVPLKYPIEAIRQSLDEEGVVLLQEFAQVDEHELEQLPLKESYNPLTHKYLSYSGELLDKKLRVILARLEAFGSFQAELLVFRPGDYTLVHDDAFEKGIVGFLSVGAWDYEDRGYLAVDHEPIFLPENALLLVHGEFRWFVKKVSSEAKKNKMIIIFRSVV